MFAILWTFMGSTALVFGIAYYFKNYDIATGKHKSLHVGLGFVMRYHPDEGTRVVIVSRLLDSPAGKADFQRGDVLISEKGIDFSNVTSPDDFRLRITRLNAMPLHVGDEVEFVLERGGVQRTVVLKAEWVKKNFYVPPTKAQWAEFHRRLETGLVHSSGFATNIETGYHIPQSRLSDAAIDAVIR